MFSLLFVGFVVFPLPQRYLLLDNQPEYEVCTNGYKKETMKLVNSYIARSGNSNRKKSRHGCDKTEFDEIFPIYNVYDQCSGH